MSEILSAAPVRTISEHDAGLETGQDTELETGTGTELETRPDVGAAESLEDRVERIFRETPCPQPLVKYVGKNKAYAQRPPPAIGEPLSPVKMFLEVLYELIRQRHKPLKPVVTVDSRPGKSVVSVTAPKTFLTQAHRYVDLKKRSAGLKAGNREKRRESVKVMDLCKARLLPLLRNTRYDASMPTSSGLRTISVEVVTTERACKRLNLWELSNMLEVAQAGVASKAPAGAATATDFLTEEVISLVIESLLRQMAAFTTACTTSTERVRIRRSRASGEDSDSEEDDANYDSDASSTASFRND